MEITSVVFPPSTSHGTQKLAGHFDFCTGSQNGSCIQYQYLIFFILYYIMYFKILQSQFIVIYILFQTFIHALYFRRISALSAYPIKYTLTPLKWILGGSGVLWDKVL